MSRIIIAWELGGGYGHLDSLQKLALALREAGQQVTIVVRDMARARRLPGIPDTALIQAPVCSYLRSRTASPVNYSEMLHGLGYARVKHIRRAVHAWCRIYASVQADLVVANHAPTAILAAKSTGTNCVLYGTGFECPPATTPLPSMRPWEAVCRERLADSEQVVLGGINQVLNDHGAAELGSVAELFQVDQKFLCTFAELDPYFEHRETTEYWGPQFEQYAGRSANWPLLSRRKRIFAYLKPGYRCYEQLLQGLSECQQHVVVYGQGLSASLSANYATKRLKFSTERLNLAQTIDRADLVICHAGHGVTAASLLSGKPLLLLPTQTEQALTAQAVTALGAGLSIGLTDKQADITAMIDELLKGKALTHAARAFADRYAGFDQEHQIQTISARLQQSL